MNGNPAKSGGSFVEAIIGSKCKLLAAAIASMVLDFPCPGGPQMTVEAFTATHDQEQLLVLMGSSYRYVFLFDGCQRLPLSK
jgi:hypothetical protein